MAFQNPYPSNSNDVKLAVTRRLSASTHRLCWWCCKLGVDGLRWRCRWRWSGWWQGEYSLLTLPASALMLFRPTVAPARPCRVPREVREFMAPALELAVVPAAGGRKKEGGRKGIERRGREGKKRPGWREWKEKRRDKDGGKEGE